MPASKASGTFMGDEAKATIVSTTDPGTYVLTVDTGAMSHAGDVLDIGIYLTLAGSTSKMCWLATVAHGQFPPVVVSPPIPSVHGFAATLDFIGADSTSFPWELIQL